MRTQISEFQTAGGFNPSMRQVGDHDALRGFRSARRSGDAGHEARVVEAARLFRDVISGQTNPFFLQQAMNPTEDMAVTWLQENYPGIFPANVRRGQFALREVMSVTDYQALFVDVIDRIYYGYYNAYPVGLMPAVRQHTLNDFRLVSRYLLDGLVTPFVAEDAAAPAPEQSLSGPVPQDGATFPTTNTAPIQYQPTLYQARASVNWRAMVNDDLGIFRDIANRLAIVANRGISQFLTQFFFGTTGPNTSLFPSNNSYTNLITTANGAASNNPPLSQQGLQDAAKVMAGMRDSSGYPILPMGKKYLIYGPAYEAVVRNLMSSTKSMIQVEGGNGNAQGFPTQFVEASNWAMQDMGTIMEPFIPLVITNGSGNIKNTAWCIVLDPAAQNRPAVEFGRLRGFETPQLFRRMPNTMRVGGGVDETMGNFDTMDNDTKIVSVFGGAVIDGRSAFFSNGSGT
jgi:hypothetical protein